MSFISEFSYPDISQRRFILFNLFFSFIILGFIYTDLSTALNFTFFYQPVLKYTSLTGLSGIFLGNLLGTFLYNKTQKTKIIYLITEFLFLCLSLFFVCSRFLQVIDINLYFKTKYLIFLISFFITFTAGLKINYFLKAACGDFIDNKRAVSPLIILSILGFSAGVFLSLGAIEIKSIYIIPGIIILLILPTAFLIKLLYNPPPMYARQAAETRQESTSNGIKRDDLFFTYANTAYILAYLYLSSETIIKFYGDFLYIKLFFIVTSVIFLASGFVIAKFFRQIFWYIYSEMMYPVLFLGSLVLTYNFNGRVNFCTGVAFFIPLITFLGFSLYQTIQHILDSYTHKTRFVIIDFSLLILPVPILIALSLIDFTYFWYLILVCLIALLNILIPGFYLMQLNIKTYKKAIYFSFSLVFIPILIFLKLYFNLPVNSELYISYSANYSKLNNINYNSRYIKDSVDVYINNVKAFRADDSTITNIKRSLIPVALYLDSPEKREKTLFIDGNQKFYKNPVIGFFKESICLDYFPQRYTDLQRLPISGSQKYVPENKDLLQYLASKNPASFFMIIDIPNLYDQNMNRFRFSDEYYRLINNYLKQDGIFTQIIDLSACSSDLLTSAAVNLKKNFKTGISFFFPHYIVIMNSNGDSLKIAPENIKTVKTLFQTQPEILDLFYNEYHFLSHFLFTEIDDIIVYIDKDMPENYFSLSEPRRLNLDKNMINSFIDYNSTIFELSEKGNAQINIYKMQIKDESRFLSLLKRTELSHTSNEYINETESLIELLRMGEYKPDLRIYIQKLLSDREKYYLDTALKFEKEKDWEQARKLYRSILMINNNNFEANYRLGILSIILQDLDNSFMYLQKAMMLKQNNPSVLYQMGILLYSSGRPQEALDYLFRALELNEKKTYLFYYIGLCYEELGKPTEAKSYYQKAALLDPNDININSSIDRIQKKSGTKEESWDSAKKQHNQDDVEKGEDMPLPINESAIDVRLQEEEASLPEKKTN